MHTDECGEYINAVRDVDGVLVLDGEGEPIYLPDPGTALVLTWMSPNVENKVITLPWSGTGYDGEIKWYVEGDDTPVFSGTFSDGDMSALTVTIEFTDTIYTSKITGTFPTILNQGDGEDYLRTVESIGCTNLLPEGLYNAFRGNESLHSFSWGDACDFAEVCTTIERTWQGCPALTAPPELSEFVNVTNIVGAFDTSWGITTPPDYSNMAKLTTMDSAFRGMTALTEIIVPTTIDLVTRSYWFAENTNNITTASIDTALNTLAASVLANSGVPSNLIIDLGLNEYSPAGTASYNYLVGLGWTIQGITAEP
jgi:hypothetical protein